MLGAERFATFAAVLSGARYPEAALAKAWVQLAGRSPRRDHRK